MEFKHNVRDLKFILKEWLPMDEIFSLDKYKEYYSSDDVDTILTEGYKIAKEMISPLNVVADQNPCELVNGVVKNPPGFKEAYQFLQLNGWGSVNEVVGQEGGMPLALYKAVGEMISAACPACNTNIKLSAGAANLIVKFGTQEDKKRFLPKLINGDWQGTMNLTEPSAGSDVGDALTRAIPTDNPRIYKIKGTKMFITAGDGDMCENVIHMVLARPTNGCQGSAGLGLYVVPKYWVDEEGNTTTKSNDVTTIGVEHKMGLYGSATCMLNYGENDECYGIMLGKAPDEQGRSKGLAMMFNMMNESRIATGHNANCQSSAAYSFSSQYTTERIQGYIGKERVPIIKHADVRRMLLDMKACTEGIRAMIFKGFWFIDIAEYSPDKDNKKAALDFEAILTPLIKCYSSEKNLSLTAEAIQVLGGVGYTKEYPVEQYLRDSKILTIWEGTSFIHGQDLVGRKMTMENGAPFKKWMGDIKTFIDANKNAEGLSREMQKLEKTYLAAEELMNLVYSWHANKAEKGKFLNLYAIKILMVFSELYVANCLLDQAVTAQNTIKNLPPDHYDLKFYKGKVQSARYYVNTYLSATIAAVEDIKSEDTSVFDIDEEVLVVS
ncbi:MAG: acyl-CoA dehydrogenase [Syntrophomonadaceae bacterium]|nr:acyl-CoA dehydrogenase [Syntrophomonadaceae bacterium]